jgi:hypothetical protein
VTQDTHPNAGRDSGYVDEEGRPIGEDLVNKVTILLAGVQTSILGLREDITATREDVAKVVQRNTDIDGRQRENDQSYQTLASYIYREMGAFFTNAGASFDRYDTSIATVEEVARGLGKFSDDIQALKDGQDRISSEIRDVDTRHGGQWEQAMTLIGDLTSRVEADEGRYDERLDRKRDMIAELRETVERHDRLIADRADQRKVEYAELVEEIVRRLQGGGDGNR